MKLSVDFNVLREHAVAAVNAHFNKLASYNLQQDHEHAAKRAAALSIKMGAASDWFSQAATIEGQDVVAFADAILQKPDEAALRGLERRKIIISIKTAKSMDEVNGIFQANGLPKLERELPQTF